MTHFVLYENPMLFLRIFWDFNDRVFMAFLTFKGRNEYLLGWALCYILYYYLNVPSVFDLFLTTQNAAYTHPFTELGIKSSLAATKCFLNIILLFNYLKTTKHEFIFYIFNLINIQQKNWESGCIQLILWKMLPLIFFSC